MRRPLLQDNEESYILDVIDDDDMQERIIEAENEASNILDQFYVFNYPIACENMDDLKKNHSKSSAFLRK